MGRIFLLKTTGRRASLRKLGNSTSQVVLWERLSDEGSKGHGQGRCGLQIIVFTLLVFRIRVSTCRDLELVVDHSSITVLDIIPELTFSHTSNFTAGYLYAVPRYTAHPHKIMTWTAARGPAEVA